MINSKFFYKNILFNINKKRICEMTENAVYKKLMKKIKNCTIVFFKAICYKYIVIIFC